MLVVYSVVTRGHGGRAVGVLGVWTVRFFFVRGGLLHFLFVVVVVVWCFGVLELGGGCRLCSSLILVFWSWVAGCRLCGS